MIDKSNKDVLWFRLDRGYFKLERDVFICFVYISPQNSSYTKKTNCDKVIFEKLERDISNFSKKGDVMIMGDLNAHINKDDKDYILNDSDHIIDDFLPGNYEADSIHKLRNTELHQKTNEYGRSVLDLCCEAQLRILNGRTIGDSMGKITYHNYIGASIDDYCLCSSNFLQNIASFSIKEFDPVYSDHCQIEAKIWSHSFKNQDNQTLNNAKYIRWNEKREKQFMGNIKNIDFNAWCHELEKKVDSNECENIINSKISELTNILMNAADGKFYGKKKKKKKPKKLFYDDECEKKYREVKRLARLLTKNPWDINLRYKVAFSKKEFNKLTRKKHRELKNKLLGDIMDCEEKNPKEFWKNINQLKEQVISDPSSNISPKDWVNYFHNLMNIDYERGYDEEDIKHGLINTIDADCLNADITTEEVLKAAKVLKNGKTCGPDGILNEMLKLTCIECPQIFVLIFNILFKTGIYPEQWKNNYIKPIFKGGCFNDPSNYRGVALSSCFGKFFSKIISSRLDDFLEKNNLICKEQIGFKQHCRTSDHIFSLKCLIDKAFKAKKKLYVSFIDFKKAFDTVNREALLLKLTRFNLSESDNFYRVFKSMYKEVNYGIKLSDGVTDMFPSKVGVKQGCVLSPTLFSIYINDMVDIFDETCDPPSIDRVNNSLSCLLYADDVVLISESAKGLQNCMNNLSNYCKKWNLTVNIDKSKIMIFNKSGRTMKKDTFYYNDNALELTNEYKYLGVIFKPSGIFTKANDYLCKKARKALFCIYKTLYSNKANIQLHLKLFESCVKPILLYCSELLCLDMLVKEKSDLNSRHFSYQPVKIQMKFAKYILGVNKTSANMAVLGDLGMFPCSIDALKLSIGYWYHLVNSRSSSLIYAIYNSLHTDTCNWYKSKIKNLFEKIKFDHVWKNQNSFSKNRLVFSVHSKLKEEFILFWKENISHINNPKAQGNKLRTYSTLKDEFMMENFLKIDIERKTLSSFVKIRISNSNLLIETGRHRNIALENRICPLCKIEIEDELHFVCRCALLSNTRTEFFNCLSDIVPNFLHLSEKEKFNYILTSNDYDVSKCCIEGISKLYSLRNELI